MEVYGDGTVIRTGAFQVRLWEHRSEVREVAGSPEATSTPGPLTGQKPEVSPYTPGDLSNSGKGWTINDKETKDGGDNLALPSAFQPQRAMAVLISSSVLKKGPKKVWFSSGTFLHTTDLAPMENVASMLTAMQPIVG